VTLESVTSADPAGRAEVRTLSGLPDEGDGVAEVGREPIFGGEDVLAGADLDGAIQARCADELPDGPAGAALQLCWRSGALGQSVGAASIDHGAYVSLRLSLIPVTVTRSAAQPRNICSNS
jgi:hypothetical protein